MTCVVLYKKGIDIHYVHVKPKNLPEGTQAVPLMMVHGWPGSFYEFYGIIPLLTEPSSADDIAFEIICPSIPGYGFSEAPQKKGKWQTTQPNRSFVVSKTHRLVCFPYNSTYYDHNVFRTGFDSVCAAHIFNKLMKRLGFNKYYVQGGDWGWLITTNMAQLEPKYVQKQWFSTFLTLRPPFVQDNIQRPSYLS